MSTLQFSGLRRLPRSGNNSCCLSFEEINIFSSLSSRWTPAASSSNLFNSFTFNCQSLYQGDSFTTVIVFRSFCRSALDDSVYCAHHTVSLLAQVRHTEEYILLNVRYWRDWNVRLMLPLIFPHGPSIAVFYGLCNLILDIPSRPFSCRIKGNQRKRGPQLNHVIHSTDMMRMAIQPLLFVLPQIFTHPCGPLRLILH